MFFEASILFSEIMSMYGFLFVTLYIRIYIYIYNATYFTCLITIKYYTVQVTNLYTDELGVPTVGCMHSHKQQGQRPFGNLHTRDIVHEIN